MKEDFLCWQSLFLFLYKKQSIKSENESKSECKYKKDVLISITKNTNKNKIQFDDYVFDRHTLKGTKEQKSHSYFSDISSAVVNEDPSINTDVKEIYRKYKKYQDEGQHNAKKSTKIETINTKKDKITNVNKSVDKVKVMKKVSKNKDTIEDIEQEDKKEDDEEKENKYKKEDKKDEDDKELRNKEQREMNELLKLKKNFPEYESELNIITRAQLVTSYSKTDSYFISMNNNLYFVKGPFKDDKEPDITINLNKIKSKLGLNLNNCVKVMMYPDGLESAISIRNKLDVKKKYPFLIYTSLCKEKNLPIQIRESKMWKPTEVVDYDKLKTCRNVDFTNKNELREMIKILIYRAILGVPDICVRNFITSKEKVYSIDEEQIGNVPFTMKFSKDVCNRIEREIVKPYYKDVYNKYVKILEEMDLDIMFIRKVKLNKNDNLVELIGL